MNKKTKGLAAIVLGGALVLGTGGTFALWHASDTIPGANVSTGHLTLQAAEFNWYVHNDGEWTTTPFDPSAETLVAGQSLLGLAGLGPALAGTYMVADLEFDVSVTMGDHTFQNGVAHNGITVEWTPNDWYEFSGLTPEDHYGRLFGLLVAVGPGNETQDVTVNIADIQMTLTQRAPVA